MPPVCKGEEKERMAELAIERARGQERDPNAIWTDGSRLDSGGVGARIAWFEEVADGTPPVVVSRRGFLGAGERRERGVRTYHEGHRSLRGARSGWRVAGFGMGAGHEAYDAELAAIVCGLVHLACRREAEVSYTIYTDSTAAMTRATSDAPGAGQETAIRIIELARRSSIREIQSPPDGPRLIEESRGRHTSVWSCFTIPASALLCIQAYITHHGIERDRRSRWTGSKGNGNRGVRYGRRHSARNPQDAMDGGRLLHEKQQEAYDAELFAIMRVVHHLTSRLCNGRNFTILTDSLTAMECIQCDPPGHGQGTAIEIIGPANAPYEQGNTLTVEWVPRHGGIAGCR